MKVEAMVIKIDGRYYELVPRTDPEKGLCDECDLVRGKYCRSLCSSLNNVYGSTTIRHNHYFKEVVAPPCTDFKVGDRVVSVDERCCDGLPTGDHGTIIEVDATEGSVTDYQVSANGYIYLVCAGTV